MTLVYSTKQQNHAESVCSDCAIRSHCLTAGFQGDDLARFEEARSHARIVHKGQHLFEVGDAFEALYVVRSGTIKATFVASDGIEQISGFYLPGEIIGLDGIENDEYVTSAEALETCSICVFPFIPLINLAKSLDGLQDRLWQHASHEIIKKQGLLMTIGHRSAEGRVADFLLSISSRFKRFGYSGVEFRLPMSRQDIGAYLGLSVETVCRVLTRFQEAGVILREQREIYIQNVHDLESLSLGASGCMSKAGGAKPGTVRKQRSSGAKSASAAG